MLTSVERDGKLVVEISREDRKRIAEDLFLVGLIKYLPIIFDTSVEKMVGYLELALVDQGVLAGTEVLQQKDGRVKVLTQRDRGTILIKRGETVMQDESFQVWFDSHPMFKDRRALFVRRVKRK